MDYNKIATDFIERMSASPHKEPLNKMQRFSKGEMFAMTFLEKAETPMSAGEIASFMNTSSARVATLLNKLEHKGFIERCIDTNDRRKIIVKITEEGKATTLKAKNMMHSHLVSVFEQMGEKDTLEFFRLTALFFTLMHESEHEEES